MNSSRQASPDSPGNGSEDQSPTVEESLDIVSGDEIEHLTEPTWLVEDILVSGSLAFLYGQPGMGKSLLALDLAGSIAAGIDFHGHTIAKPAGVLYIVAEGLGDFGQRVKAFRLARGLEDLKAITYVLESINVFDFQWLSLVEEIERLKLDPALIIIDTLSRCTVGAEENSAKDMGKVVANLDALRGTTEAAVLVVHHTGKDGRLLRGSSVLEGAADTVLKLRDSHGLVLSCDKQKSASSFSPIRLRMEPTADSVSLRGDRTDTHLSADEQVAVKLVSTEALTNSDWLRLFVDKTKKSESTFQRMLKPLIDKGMVEKQGEDRGALYQATKKGKTAVGVKTGTWETRSS